MQLTKRNRLSPDARHQQLLTLGIQVFGAHAYDTISTDEISRLAGISKGLLYHYFPSKKAYYLATLEAASSQLLAATQVDEQLGALDNLRNSIRLLLDFAAAQPFLFKALVRGGVGTDSETANVVEGVREALAARLLSLTNAPESPEQGLRLYGWLGMAEFICIRWLDTDNISRLETEETLYTSALWALFGNTPTGAAA